MNMNMKNEKTMLALVLVAALAMVSVAGVALASESDADSVDVSKLTPVEGDLNIKASTSDSYGIYGTSTVIINADANYTGTLCFGTYDKAAKIYTSIVTLTLTGVSNAIIDYIAGTDYITITVNEVGTKVTGVVSGDIVISQGNIYLGSTTYFTGSVSGNTSAIEAVNVSGLFLNADTTDVVSGTVSQGSMKMIDTTVTTSIEYIVAPAKVTVSGTASIDDMTIGNATDNVTLTIAEDAKVTSSNGADYYVLAAAKTFTLTVGTDASKIIDADVYDSNGVKVASSGTTTGTSGAVTMTVLTGKEIKLNDTYTLQIVYTDGTKLYAYSGTLSFNVTFKTVSGATSIDKITAIVSPSASLLKLDSTVLKSESLSVLSYDNSIYRCLAAYNLSTGFVITATADYWSTDGEVTFYTDPLAETPAVVNFANGNYLGILLQDKTTGQFYVYYGTVGVATGATTFTVSTTNSGINVLAVSSAATTGAIVTGAEAVSSSDAVLATQTVEVTVKNNSKLVVNGTLDMTYVSETSNAKITNDGIITVNGKITVQNDIADVIAHSGAYNSKSGVLNASMYMTTSTTTPKYTITYTTLADATAAASEITVFGNLTVESNTELTGNGTANKITIGLNAYVKVGIKADADATPAIVGVTANLTLPTTTTLTLSGVIDVQNGKFIVMGSTIPTYATTQVVADVLISTTAMSWYTDLKTALDEASSGDTVSLRMPSTKLSADATLAEGVTLTTSVTTALTIESGVTFTVNGEIKNLGIITVEEKTKLLSAGTLILNNEKVSFDGLNLAGVLTINANLEWTIDVTILNEAVEKYEAVINANGEIILKAAINSEDTTTYVILNVNGKFTTGTGASLDADIKKLTTNLTGEFIADKTPMFTDDLTMTNGATITLSTGMKFYVMGNAVIGTASSDIKAYTNTASGVITLLSDASSKPKVLVYGTADDFSVEAVTDYVNSTSATVVTTTYYFENAVYAVAYSISGNSVAAADYLRPELTSYNFLAWYSEPAFVTTPLTANSIGVVGAYVEVFGNVTDKTVKVTIQYTQNGTWLIDGKNIGASGSIDLIVGTHTITFVADNGYELGDDYVVYVDGKAITGNSYNFQGDVSVSYGGEVKEKSTDGGLDLVTILLIIITIVIIIMAIIIALKLMRS